jgi:hypothetical protein
MDLSIGQINHDLLDITLDPDSPSLYIVLHKIVSDLDMVLGGIQQLKQMWRTKPVYSKEFEALNQVKKEIQLLLYTLVKSLQYFISLQAEPAENANYPNVVMGREVDFNDNFVGNLPTATHLRDSVVNENAPLGRFPTVLARRTKSSKKTVPINRTHRRTRLNTRVRTGQGSRI